MRILPKLPIMDAQARCYTLKTAARQLAELLHPHNQNSAIAGYIILTALLALSNAAGSKGWNVPQTRVYDFTVKPLSITRLCSSKTIVSMNGKFPGPTIYGNTGDTIIVRVTNRAQYDISIHWHGVRQILSCWADGPAYITQCPLQTGQSYVYNFTLTGQSGTLFWHAHETWLRGTVYGAIVIFPEAYPYISPDDEHVILLGEWWKANVEDVETQALQAGNGPAIADAYTINGLPGPLYNCSSQDIYVMKLHSNKTYLLRIVNAALNTELFFSIANHNLTVVEIDGDFTKHYTTNIIFLTPGQTTNVLLKTDRPGGRYYMGASPYMSAKNVPFQMTRTLGLLQYGSSASPTSNVPSFPATNDTNFVTQFSNSLRSLDDADHPEGVPQTVDKSLFFTVGLGSKPCDSNQTCQGPNGSNFTASMNNISLILPRIAILQAYYFNISGVFQSTFPDSPLSVFDYTATNSPNNLTPESGTRVNVIPFNSNVQLILQDTSLLGIENHPIHLHGYSFYIVGQGFGNFQASSANFNLVDPPRRNTVGVPVGGWSAIRFKADNPGVWYMHCHLEIHTTWGLAMTFIVPNGIGANQTLPPPPSDLPAC